MEAAATVKARGARSVLVGWTIINRALDYRIVTGEIFSQVRFVYPVNKHRN